MLNEFRHQQIRERALYIYEGCDPQDRKAMPSKKIVSCHTNIVASQPVERAAESQANDLPHPVLVGVLSPPQASVVGMDQFNSLVVQVQNLVVAIQAIHAILAPLPVTPLLQVVACVASQPPVLPMPVLSLAMQQPAIGAASPPSKKS